MSTESIDQRRGRLAYEAYRHAAGGISLATGDILPTWPLLKDEIRAGWCAVAVAVAQDVLTRRVAGEPPSDGNMQRPSFSDPKD